jgi:hypothetical protein
MKLIFCAKCQDVVKLTYHLRYCGCGECWGRYLEDGLNAQISANAIPLGFLNSSLINALRDRPKEGMGSEFVAFVIPEKCDTIEVKK